MFEFGYIYKYIVSFKHEEEEEEKKKFFLFSSENILTNWHAMQSISCVM